MKFVGDYLMIRITTKNKESKPRKLLSTPQALLIIISLKSGVRPRLTQNNKSEKQSPNVPHIVMIADTWNKLDLDKPIIENWKQ